MYHVFRVTLSSRIFSRYALLPNTSMIFCSIKVWCCTTFYWRAMIGHRHNHSSISTHELWQNCQSVWSMLYVSQFFFIVQIELYTMNNNVYWNNDWRLWTSTLDKFPGKRGGSPMDVLKYQVFPYQNFPRHTFLHYYALYPVTRIISF